jgi:hypothetical protein
MLLASRMLLLLDTQPHHLLDVAQGWPDWCPYLYLSRPWSGLLVQSLRTATPDILISILSRRLRLPPQEILPSIRSLLFFLLHQGGRAAGQDQATQMKIQACVLYLVDSCVLLVTLQVLGPHREAICIPDSKAQH